jgi:hypothetical protein
MKIAFLIAGFIALCVASALLISLPVLWLWNWLMPVIFGLKTITWIQALGLSILCGMLFKPTGATLKK